MSDAQLKGYRVTWEIDVEASCPQEAAEKARHYQIKPDTTATVFDVIEHDGDGSVVRIDLTYPEESGPIECSEKET
jgi:hypothetical protein